MSIPLITKRRIGMTIIEQTDDVVRLRTQKRVLKIDDPHSARRVDHQVPGVIIAVHQHPRQNLKLLRHTVKRRRDTEFSAKFGKNHTGYGWAGPKMRWCTTRLKTDIINRYLTDLRKKYDVVQYVGIAADEARGSTERAWTRTQAFFETIGEDELLDPTISAETLLFRLFHEEGVRVYDPVALKNECRCSPERVERVLASMSDEDIADIVEDGKITMTCEFCSRNYIFDPQEIKKGTIQ